MISLSLLTIDLNPELAMDRAHILLSPLLPNRVITSFCRPPALNVIQDQKLLEFALDLNVKWKQLGRQIKQKVKDAEDRYSLIYLPQPFIIPGGRFREIFYWWVFGRI